MEFLDFLRSHIQNLPNLARFAVAMAIIVGVPPLARRLRIPGVVGLLLFGVLIGPHVLALFPLHPAIADFFADLGKLLLMFFCGLEVDLALFRRSQTRSILFGLLTTCIPLMLGTAVGILFGFGLVPAIVLGSLLASHTLLGCPIVARLGLTRREPITITIGATIVSDTLSLVVFAVCVSTYQKGFSVSSLALQLLEIAIFVPFILVGLSRAGRYLLKKVEDDENAYFVLMLAILAVAALLATTINLPGIVGAFLAGLAVNAAVREKPAKEKLEFLGNSLFIPTFFVVTGFLVDPVAFAQVLTKQFALASAIVVALIVGKWIAVQIAGRAFSYSADSRKTMWSLTLPQVAATLAATLVAFNTFDPAGQRLLDNRLLNVVLVLVLTTSILGPVLTERYAPRLLSDDSAPATEPVSSEAA